MDPSSMELFKFPQAPQIFGPRLVRERRRPQGPGDFPDIKVASRVNAHSVRTDECRGSQPSMCIAKAAQQSALMVDDADARPEIGAVAVDRHRRPEFADVADRVPEIIHVEAARPVQVVPLRLVFSVAVEHLDAVVLAIGDINPAVGVGAYVVHDIELAGAGAGLAPRHQQFAVGREFVNARIAVTVGDVDLAFRGERRVRAAVKRLTAHIGRGLAGDADLEQQFAVERALAHEMSAVIGQIDRVVWPHMDAVRPRILPLTPRAQEISVTVEHDDRVLPAREAVDVVFAVDRDRGDLLERPALRQFRPVLDDAIFEIAGADDVRHFASSANVPRVTLSKRWRANNPSSRCLASLVIGRPRRASQAKEPEPLTTHLRWPADCLPWLRDRRAPASAMRYRKLALAASVTILPG